MLTQEQKDKVKEVIGFLRTEAFNNAAGKGFWVARGMLQELANKHALGYEMRGMIEGQMLALTHSELSEGLEGIRKDLQDDHLPQFKMIECEFADALIRIFDHCEYYDYDLAEALTAKMEYNAKRPFMHGGKAF